MRDIVEYDLSAAMSCLSHSARLRETLVRNFYQVGVNAIDGGGAPYAFVIPTQQHDHSAASRCWTRCVWEWWRCMRRRRRSERTGSPSRRGRG